MKLTQEQLEERLARNPALAKRNPELGSVARVRIGPRPGLKEQHVQHRGQRKSQVEKAMCPKFRVSITLDFADYRTRDADAALSTLLDCVIAARRQLENHTGDFDCVS